jgi:hypothetical protein
MLNLINPNEDDVSPKEPAGGDARSRSLEPISERDLHNKWSDLSINLCNSLEDAKKEDSFEQKEKREAQQKLYLSYARVFIENRAFPYKYFEDLTAMFAIDNPAAKSLKVQLANLLAENVDLLGEHLGDSEESFELRTINDPTAVFSTAIFAYEYANDEGLKKLVENNIANTKKAMDQARGNVLFHFPARGLSHILLRALKGDSTISTEVARDQIKEVVSGCELDDSGWVFYDIWTRSKEGPAIAKEILQDSFQFEPDECKEILRIWKMSSGYPIYSMDKRDHIAYIAGQNLNQMARTRRVLRKREDIRRAVVGEVSDYTEADTAVATLYRDFNLANLARYPEQALADQFESKDENAPYMVSIGAQRDYNHSFSDYPTRKIYGWLYQSLKSTGHKLRFAESGGGTDFVKRLLRFHNRYGREHRISALNVDVHASRNSVSLGEFTDPFAGIHKKQLTGAIVHRLSGQGGREDTPDDENNPRARSKRDRTIFEPHATIIINGCDVAAPDKLARIPFFENSSFVETLAKESNLTVIGNEGKGSFTSLKAYKDSSGRLCFHSKASTRAVTYEGRKGQVPENYYRGPSGFTYSSEGAD